MPSAHLKRTILALATLAFFAGEAAAIKRVEIQNLSCERVKSILAQEGAAILRYPSKRTPGLTLYDRYVENRHACLLGEATERASVPTADRENCPVLRCYRPDHVDDDRIIIPFR